MTISSLMWGREGQSVDSGTSDDIACETLPEQTTGGYMQITFRKCADSGKQDGQDGQVENVERRDGGV